MANSQSIFRRSVKQCLAMTLAIAGTSAALNAQKAEDRPVSRGDFTAAMLAEHNAERRVLGALPLVWDRALASDARRWASRLAAEHRFEHALAELPRKKQGENLWMGTADSYDYEEMVAFWLNERKMAKSGVFPDVSRTGNWVDVGHYSQMIWPATRKMGCALARNADDEFLVCRYFPAGNRTGDRLNVNLRK